jgi:uridine kinase
MHVSVLQFSMTFYLITREEEMKNIGKYNFDHPDAFDWDLVRKTIRMLVNRQDVIIPSYNYSTCKRDQPGIHVKCTDLILFEGIFALLDKEI